MSDEIEEGEPIRRKKKPLPRDDEEEAPRKRSRARDDDDQDDDDLVIRKKKKRRAVEDDEDDDDADDIGNSPLGAVVPLGVSIWALASFYTALLSCICPGGGLLAILFGVIAFATQKQKATYGSISGNMRAVLGIIIGICTVIFQIVVLIATLLNRR